MNCHKCGAENPEGAKFCSKCGQSFSALISEQIQTSLLAAECPSCKSPRKENAKFCGSCGLRFEDAIMTVPTLLTSAVTMDGVQDSASATQPSDVDAPQGNNTVIIVLILALVAIIGAAGTGWYVLNDGKSAPSLSTSASVPQGVQGQSGVPTQPQGMPKVDANGLPIPQPESPVQAGADVQQQPIQDQPNAKVPRQEVMPKPVPQESRKRPSVVESQPSRPPLRVGGSIDEQYNQRAATECPAGATGLFCREKVRYQLCNSHWSGSPPVGQRICQK